MIDGGADVLFFYANEVGLGATQAAKEKGAKFVGFASNQNNVAPGTVVASVYFDFASLYKWTVQKFMSAQRYGRRETATLFECPGCLYIAMPNMYSIEG